MPELTTDIPAFPALIRREYLFDADDDPEHPEYGKVTPVQVFAVTSIEGRALGFHVLTDEGVMRDQVPVSALVMRKDAARIPLEFLQQWACFSYHVVAIEYAHLRHLRCLAVLKDRRPHWGTYRFTVDWYGNDLSEEPTERKSGHVVELDNGCLAVLPNHRVLWREGSFVARPLSPEAAGKAGYRVTSKRWLVERLGRWHTTDDERQFYDYVEAQDDPEERTAWETARQKAIDAVNDLDDEGAPV